MSVTPTNLIQGPATLYWGLYQAVEPLDASVNGSPATSAWTDLGGTTDGLTLSLNREFSELSVDQIIDVVERRQTKRDVQVKTNLAEATLENLKIALNGGTITTNVGNKTYDPDISNSGLQPTYFALIADGWAPTPGKRRRVIMRKCLSIANVEGVYKKDGQFVWPVTFGIHYVDSTTKPIHIVDET